MMAPALERPTLDYRLGKLSLQMLNIPLKERDVE